jgi:Ca2+-transporting ATPase
MIAVVIGFFQERKTAKILQELTKIIKHQAEVIREGSYQIVDSEELVPGDIIILNAGSKVPADARVLESHELKVDEAVLTGEWLAETKRTDSLPVQTFLSDRSNMVYMGTIVERGKGKALVVETGLRTEIGKIAKILKEIKKGKTPYQKKLEKFSRIIGVVIVVLSFLIFSFGILGNNDPLEMLLISVAISVAALPEGLPAAVTVVFAFGMREILKKKGLVRKLIAAETLGSTSIICTDKTGTLTEGKMEIAQIIASPKDNELALKIGFFVQKLLLRIWIILWKSGLSGVDLLIELYYLGQYKQV